MLKRSSLSKQIRRVRLDTTYFAENWKYCNKIIFKCVNSNVRPIFILFFFWIKWLWVLWTVRKPFFFIFSNKPTSSSALPSLQRPSTNVVYVTLVRVLFFFTPNFISVPPIYTTNELLGFSKYFLLYYSINHKYFISHYLNWVVI